MKNYAFFLTAEVDWEDFGENEPKQLFQPLVALIKKERAFDPALTMIHRLSETIEIARNQPQVDSAKCNDNPYEKHSKELNKKLTNLFTGKAEEFFNAMKIVDFDLDAFHIILELLRQIFYFCLQHIPLRHNQIQVTL